MKWSLLLGIASCIVGFIQAQATEQSPVTVLMNDDKLLYIHEGSGNLTWSEYNNETGNKAWNPTLCNGESYMNLTSAEDQVSLIFNGTSLDINLWYTGNESSYAALVLDGSLITQNALIDTKNNGSSGAICQPFTITLSNLTASQHEISVYSSSTNFLGRPLSLHSFVYEPYSNTEDGPIDLAGSSYPLSGLISPTTIGIITGAVIGVFILIAVFATLVYTIIRKKRERAEIAWMGAPPVINDGENQYITYDSIIIPAFPSRISSESYKSDLTLPTIPPPAYTERHTTRPTPSDPTPEMSENLVRSVSVITQTTIPTITSTAPLMDRPSEDTRASISSIPSRNVQEQQESLPSTQSVFGSRNRSQDGLDSRPIAHDLDAHHQPPRYDQV